MAPKTAIRRDENGIWQAPGIPVSIEYSTQVLEELRAAAEEGFQKIPHGGIEIGAVLLGTRDAGVVRVLEWRPIECEHAKGPGFVLSQKDFAGLESLLESCRQAPELRTLEPVGWFHTHTRSRIFLSADDLAIHERFFGAAGVALVMRLAKDQPATAGFFAAGDNGEMQAESSAREFTVNPDPAALAGPIRLTAARRSPPRRESRTTRPPAQEAAAGAPAPAERRETPAPVREMPRLGVEPEPEPVPIRPEPDPEPSRFGPRAVAAVAVLAVLAGTAWMVTSWYSQPPATAALRLVDNEGQLEIRWDRSSNQILSADSGKLTIQDGAGSKPRVLTLTADDVRRGGVFYPRGSESVQVRLELSRGGDPLGSPGTDSFVGQAPPARAVRAAAPADQPEKLRQELDRLEERFQEEMKRGNGLKKKIREAEDQLRRESGRR